MQPVRRCQIVNVWLAHCVLTHPILTSGAPRPPLRRSPMARRSAISLVAASLLGLTACGDQATSLLSPTGANSVLLPRQPGVYLLGFDGVPSISPDVLAA